MKRNLAACAALSLSLSACAAFTSSPTSSECARAQSELTGAQAALTLVETALASAQAAGAGSGVINALTLATTGWQNEIIAIQKIVATNCAVGAGVSTPLGGGVGVQLAPSPNVSAHVGAGS